MSRSSRAIYLLIGIAIFGFCGWLIVVVVSKNPNHTWLGIPMSVWIGTLGSISASGIFFTVSETLRWLFDATVSRAYQRLQFYEDTIGIIDYFTQKGGDDANKDYKKAITEAQHRVWAFGISNGEFLYDHLTVLIEKKKRRPILDVCICFVDPDTKIIISRPATPAELSQVQLFDSTRNGALVADDSLRVRSYVNAAAADIAASHVDIAIKLVSTAGYVSAMVVDDVIYMFPFMAVSKDNTRTPYLKVMATSHIGQVFLSFFENIKDHSLLSRSSL